MLRTLNPHTDMDRMRIRRAHGEWWILERRQYRIPGDLWGVYDNWGVISNPKGPYENVLAEFFRLLNNDRKIRAIIAKKEKEITA